MELLKRVISNPHIRYVAKYRKIVGIFLLVAGLMLTVSGGVQYAFYEKPALQEKVLAAFIPTATPVEATPKVEPTITAQVTYGPRLPIASVTPTLSKISDTPVPSETQTPAITSSLTPTPTLQNISPTPTSEQKEIAAAILSTSTVMVSVTPTSTMTPTPTPDTSGADDAVWDKLAQCESNNHWDDNTGNGYYGGLQFGLGTWAAVGGTGRPDQASREEQIKRGKILQSQRGWSPWGGCGKKLGLL